MTLATLSDALTLNRAWEMVNAGVTVCKTLAGQWDRAVRRITTLASPSAIKSFHQYQSHEFPVSLTVTFSAGRRNTSNSFTQILSA